MNLEPQPILRDTMRALGFLTRLPIASKWFEGDDGSLSETCRAFPLAAAIATAPALFTIIVGSVLDMPPLLIALIAFSAYIVTCGALHDDGIADVADGFYGGKTVARRLEIMKDSQIGTYGALASVISVSVRVVALAAILQLSPLCASLALIAAAAIGRCALIWHWSELNSARAGGISDKAGAPSEDAQTFALTTGIALTLTAALLARGVLPTVLACVFTIGITVLFQKLCSSKIGGQTGDTLGASVILAEIAFLTGLASGL